MHIAPRHPHSKQAHETNIHIHESANRYRQRRRVIVIIQLIVVHNFQFSSQNTPLIMLVFKLGFLANI
jgi:hypothetical protein